MSSVTGDAAVAQMVSVFLKEAIPAANAEQADED
jgi:hypothetical protein